MGIKKINTFIVVIIVVLLPILSIAGDCDVNDIIFNPSYNDIDQSTWFKRGESFFTIEIVGNNNCSGQVLPQVALTNTAGVNRDIDVLNDVKLKFNDGSNKIKLFFEAGEEGCTAILGKADCQLELFVKTPASKDGFWSGGNYALLKSGFKNGKLKYECDKRFNLCNGSLKFKLIKIEGGEIIQ